MEERPYTSFEVGLGWILAFVIGGIIGFSWARLGQEDQPVEKCAPVKASWSQSKRDLLYAMPDGRVIGIISFDRVDDSFAVYAPSLAHILAHYTAEDLAKEAMEQFWRNNPCQVKEAR